MKRKNLFACHVESRPRTFSHPPAGIAAHRAPRSDGPTRSTGSASRCKRWRGPRNKRRYCRSGRRSSRRSGPAISLLALPACASALQAGQWGRADYSNTATWAAWAFAGGVDRVVSDGAKPGQASPWRSAKKRVAALANHPAPRQPFLQSAAQCLASCHLRNATPPKGRTTPEST